MTEPNFLFVKELRRRHTSLYRSIRSKCKVALASKHCYTLSSGPYVRAQRPQNFYSLSSLLDFISNAASRSICLVVDTECVGCDSAHQMCTVRVRTRMRVLLRVRILVLNTTGEQNGQNYIRMMQHGSLEHESW